jgi:putative peptidoglycan lipid II flippase
VHHENEAHTAARQAAGARVVGGRYRLSAMCGCLPHLQFWKALDTGTDVPVALTLVDPDGCLPADRVDEILYRTLRVSRVHMTGVARVLALGAAPRGGFVAAEWIRGGTLGEVADTAPAPIAVAQAMQTLAAAADAAHRAGIALSIDHRDRLRVSTNGDVVLAFPATMPDATPDQDLKGIGCALDALLAGRRREIPFLMSATASGLQRGSGTGIDNAATVLTLLQEAACEAAAAAPSLPAREPPPLPAPGHYAEFRGTDPNDTPEARRRKRMLTALGAGAAIILVALIVLASTLSRFVGNSDTRVSLDKDQLGLNASPTAPALPTVTPTQAAAAGGGVLVKPVQAVVFSPGGAPDSPETAGLAIDDNPATAWSTDTYFDAVPFPKFKDGVGLLLQLAQPTVLGVVSIDLSSSGTVIQIRSSASATPARLADTAELTAPTPMQQGHNDIPVNNQTPTTNVVVWISTLGVTSGKSHSDVSEITLQAAPRQ